MSYSQCQREQRPPMHQTDFLIFWNQILTHECFFSRDRDFFFFAARVKIFRGMSSVRSDRIGNEMKIDKIENSRCGKYSGIRDQSFQFF